MHKKTIVGITLSSVGLLVLIAVWIVTAGNPPPSATGGAPMIYSCDGGKTIKARFEEGATLPPLTPGGPPRPGGSATIFLSDGRTFNLKQTISTDGVRYSNGYSAKQGDENFVFWSKGNGAIVLENNVEKGYTGCISIVEDPGGLSEVYTAGSNGFSIRYPKGWVADGSYTYDLLGPEEPKIYGVKFRIADSFAAGTNLSTSDTGLSVEVMPGMPECTAHPFLISPKLVVPQNVGGVEYSVASSSDAAAGNRYEETVYALSGTNPCLAVRYFIHYGAIENYPKAGESGAVTEFDRAALISAFDSIRATLVVGK